MASRKRSMSATDEYPVRRQNGEGPEAVTKNQEPGTKNASYTIYVLEVNPPPRAPARLSPKRPPAAGPHGSQDHGGCHAQAAGHH